MKKILNNQKPLSKAEQVYLKMLQDRHPDTIFSEVFAKARNNNINKTNGEQNEGNNTN